MDQGELLRQLKNSSIYFFEWNLERVARCLEELSEDQVWERPNGSSNSVGNQLLHLCGNLRQWVLSGLGGRADLRERDAEFAATGGNTKAELFAEFNRVIADCVAEIEQLTEAGILPERPVQAYVHDGTFVLMHVTEHLSYHVGQVVFWTKLLVDRDLDMYGGDDLNAKGEVGNDG